MIIPGAKERTTCSSAVIVSLPLAPAVNIHLLIRMPQTYTVSPGGDTVYHSATRSHRTLRQPTAVISPRSVHWHANGI